MTHSPAPKERRPRPIDLPGEDDEDGRHEHPQGAPGNASNRPPAHRDSLLESIGKAVSEPVRDAADPDSDEKPRS